jgi:hypothetical protein
MEQETLHKLRMIMPGLILLIVLFFLFQPDVDATKLLNQSVSEDSVLYIVAAIAVIGMGVTYYLLNLRKYAMKNPLEKIRENIERELLRPFLNNEKISGGSSELKKDRKLMNIFYGFVDNDKSLEKRSKEVYLNGLILSTTADIRIISLFAAVLYLIVWRNTQTTQYLFFTEISVAVLISTFIIMPLVTKKHIELSNLQLELIVTKYKKELQNELVKALK